MSVRSSLLEEAIQLNSLARPFPPPATAIAAPDGKIQAASDPTRTPSIQSAVRSIVTFFSGDWRLGDIALTNDPFLGGSCINEFTLVCNGGNALGVARMNALDIGGMHFGGISPDAFDLWGEGARFTPLKIRTSTGLRKQAVRLILLNSRRPGILQRALDAMCRIAESVSRLDIEEGAANLELATTALRLLSPGRHEVEEQIEVPDRPPGPTVRVVLEVSDDGLRIDFSRSDEQTEFPVNSTPSHTADCCLAVLEEQVPGFTSSSDILDYVAIETGEGTVTGAKLPATLGLSPFVTARAIRRAVSRTLAASGGRVSDPDSWWRLTGRQAFDRCVEAESLLFKRESASQMQDLTSAGGVF